MKKGRKLGRSFYLEPALKSAKKFLGKVLVHKTPKGIISGIINEVEAYPAFYDKVHHGNKKTPRTEVMWGKGGYAYVYLIYGVWSQFAAVVNKKNIPDVVFIRSTIPWQGIKLMRGQWDKKVPDSRLANSPGKLCKSFLINKKLYGTDLTGDELFLEDWGIQVPKSAIEVSKRVGISSVHEGHDLPFRFFVKLGKIKIPKLS